MEDYCDKCGWFWQRSTQNEHSNTCGCCEICGNTLKPVPKEYYEEFQGILFVSNEMKQKLIQDLVLTSPNFDQYLFDHKDEDMFNKRMSDQAKMEHGKTVLEEKTHQPECPTCHSKNVQHISGLERGASIIGLGIFSKKINKSFKCKSCGYTW